MEKKIAAKMLLTSVEIGSKNGHRRVQHRSKMLLEALGLSWGPPGTLLGALGAKSRLAEKLKIVDSTAFFVVFGPSRGPSRGPWRAQGVPRRSRHDVCLLYFSFYGSEKTQCPTVVLDQSVLGPYNISIRLVPNQY